MPTGVLGIQGAVSEHVEMLERLGEKAVIVKTADDLRGIGALIIPGGESTTLGKFLGGGLGDGIKKLFRKGVPIYGTCTGLIVLGKVEGNSQHTLGLMDVSVQRNAFGRQADSFESEIVFPAIGKKPFRCVFIRAPLIKKAGENVDVLGRFRNKIIFARQGNLLASSFHPELTDDTRIHEYFLGMARSGK